ncbi:MAG: rod shape-determining protein MreD [Rickettsiaceae bacterium]|jgi:rod shape-determining protein MreD|nr:rod shape-determining protein MreD [Rickettsiaceae bacterium]
MPITYRLKLFIPKILAILFIFLGYIQTRFFGLDSFFPAIDVMLIFYFSLQKPQVVPTWFVFSLGLLKDIISGEPLGVNALSYLILRGLVVYRTDFLRRSFVFVWQGFCVFAALVIIFKWLVFSFVYDSALGINAACMQFLLTVLLYPFFHSVFNLIGVILPRNSSHA